MNYKQESIFKSFKDFCFALFSNWVFQQIVYFLFPFVLSYVLESSGGSKSFGLKTFYSFPQIIYFIGYILILICFSVADKHLLKQEKFTELNRAVVDELQNNISSLTQYMTTLENDEKLEIFASLSQFVCDSLYTVFSNRFDDRSFRISVIKQFLNSNELMYTMPGFKSGDLSTGDNRPRLVKDCNKYYKKILQMSEEKYCIFNEKEIEENFTQNPNHEKLAEYIAIPHKGDFNNICFILQIDSTKKETFGKSKEETESFINNYIRPFVNLLENAYVQERMNLFNRGAD